MAMTHQEQLKYIHSLPRTKEWGEKISIAKTKERISLICKYCKKEFKIIKGKKEKDYCCVDCRKKDKRIVKICPICNNEFETLKSSNQKYCSRKCYHEAQKSFTPWSKGTIGVIGWWNKGRKLSEEHKLKLSIAKKNAPPRKKSIKKRKKISEETRERMRISALKRFYSDVEIEKLPYKYNKRNDPAYKDWRKQVLERDNYQCVVCGEKYTKEHKLVVHHILPWRNHVKERYNINNGITLCQHHHPRKKEDEERLILEFQKLVGSYEQ